MEYYRNLGYDCEVGKELEVKTEDLQPYSEVKIKYKCDYPGCDKIIELSYSDYFKKRKRKYSEYGDFCNEHNKAARKKWMEENEKEQYKQDYNDRVEKRKKTCIEKYGVDNPMKNEQVVENLKRSMLEKHGVDNPMHKKEFRENFVKSMIKNNPEYSEYYTESGKIYYRKNGVPCSKNQKYLGDLFNCQVNYFIEDFSVDLLLTDKIYLEYNGTGHKISIIYGHLTEEEYNKKEIIRYSILKRKGYKQIVLTSEHKNFLPSDDILISIKDVGIQYLNESVENNWIDFNYDNNKIRIKGKEIEYNFDHIIDINYIK